MPNSGPSWNRNATSGPPAYFRTSFYFRTCLLHLRTHALHLRTHAQSQDPCPFISGPVPKVLKYVASVKIPSRGLFECQLKRPDRKHRTIVTINEYNFAKFRMAGKGIHTVRVIACTCWLIDDLFFLYKVRSWWQTYTTIARGIYGTQHSHLHSQRDSGIVHLII